MAPLVIGVAIWALRGFRASLRFLILFPTVLIISMLWAVAPDLPRLFGMHDLYMRLYLDPRCDIFYWHYAIDQVEGDTGLWGIGLVAIAIALMTVAWRELRAVEEGR